MVQQTQQSINSFIGLLGNLYQLPHPQMPDKPLASDPNLDLTGFLYRSLEFLRKELSYSGRYKPDSSAAAPTSSAAPTGYAPAAATPVRDEPHPRPPRHHGQQVVPPQAPAYQAPAQAAQASAPAANPWQQAFQALSASLNTSNPPRPRFHPRLTRRRQRRRQLHSPAGLQWQPTQSAAPTYSPQASTQALLGIGGQLSWCSRRLSSGASSPASDAYLSGIS